MTLLPSEAKYPTEPLQWCLPTVQIWCFWLLLDWRYIDFQTDHFADFEHFKIDFHFANFGLVKIDPICSLLLTVDRSQLFTNLGKTYHKTQVKKFKNQAQDLAPVIFKDSIRLNQELVSLVSK